MTRADADWAAARIRVRQNYVRGHWGSPKSRRGSRSVPMADRAAAELERLFQRSAFQCDDDLVFAHPYTGQVLDHSDLVRRYKRALRAAHLREVRFNDLRHTFGTRMAAAGVPLRALQEWMGHRDFKTTLIYADYCPSEFEAEMVERAFARGGAGERWGRDFGARGIEILSEASARERLSPQPPWGFRCLSVSFVSTVDALSPTSVAVISSRATFCALPDRDIEGFRKRYKLKIATGSLCILKLVCGRWTIKAWDLKP